MALTCPTARRARARLREEAPRPPPAILVEGRGLGGAGGSPPDSKWKTWPGSGQAGIESMRVIALGERFHVDGLVESFLITEELRGSGSFNSFSPSGLPPAAR